MILKFLCARKITEEAATTLKAESKDSLLKHDTKHRKLQRMILVKVDHKKPKAFVHHKYTE